MSEGLQPRTEAGRCQLQRKVGPRTSPWGRLADRGKLAEMMRRLILIKYSDVFVTAPDAHGYFAQVRRCVGDIPLNVFATINGYFSAERGLEAQPSLEHELVSGIVNNMVRRFRRRRAKDEDSLIFTRASGLLNLKVLLSVPRPDEAFVSTTVGMLALHANDYTDISLPEADPELFAVENMPIWDLHNPRDIADLLARYYFVLHDMFAGDRRVVELFEEEFKTTPRSVTIDGLAVDDYFALLFGLYTAASSAGREQKTAILNLEEHFRLLGISDERASQFITSRVATEESFMQRFERLDDSDSFADHIQRPAWALDFRAFRERPLLRLRDGRVIVVDLHFLIENASVGIFWNLFRCMTESGRERLLRYWGTVFEHYIRRQMEAHPPADGHIVFNLDPDGLEVDALLTQGSDVFVFEIKAGMVPQDAKCSRDVPTVRKAIERKFVRNVKGNPKGITQLAVRCVSLTQRKQVGRVYPILIVDEHALQTPGVNTYLARRLRAMVDGHADITSLAVITADELELMLPYLSAGDVKWKELLDARIVDGEVSANPVSTTFGELASVRGLRRRNNRILGPVRNRLSELLRKKYEHLK
jgi:hypothetical protein